MLNWETVIRAREAWRVADENKENELDFDAVLADLSRQAHDKELEALANLTLLRSDYSNDPWKRVDDEQKDLDERLRKIMEGITND